MAFGREWWRVGAASIPTFEDYAQRIGARLVVLAGRALMGHHPHWEKMALRAVLEEFDRALWVDLDAVVRPFAPNIFEVVPEGTFAAFDEGFKFDREDELMQGSWFYDMPVVDKSVRKFRYFNAGVMVVDRSHRDVFRLPDVCDTDTMMPEQTYVNVKVLHGGYQFQALPGEWNGFHSLYPKESRHSLNIVHYPGWPKVGQWVDRLVEEMEQDSK